MNVWKDFWEEFEKKLREDDLLVARKEGAVRNWFRLTSARKYFENILDMSWKYFGHVLEIFWTYLGNILDMSWKYFEDKLCEDGWSVAERVQFGTGFF